MNDDLENSSPETNLPVDDNSTPQGEFDDWWFTTHKTTRVEIREEPDDSDELDLDRLEYDEDY